MSGPNDDRAALAEAVSNALSAATEGSDWDEAPEPSDEPGSPYVYAITDSLLGAGVHLGDEEPTKDDVLRVIDHEATGLTASLGRHYVEWLAGVIAKGLATSTEGDSR